MEKSLGNKVLRTGVSLALVAGMSIPVSTSFAEDVEVSEVTSLEAKDKPVVKDVEAETSEDVEGAEKQEVKKDDLAVDEQEVVKPREIEQTVKSSEDVATLASVEEVAPVAALAAEDPILTDEVVLGDSATGVYMSVRGTESDSYLYMRAVKDDNTADVWVGFYDWETYIASDYYTKVVAPYASKISRIEIADGANIKLTGNCSCLFSGMPALTDISDLAKLDTSGLTQMAEMFSCDTALSDLSPIAGWDVSNVEMMYLAFRECPSITTLAPLSNWQTSSLTDVSGAFYKDEGLTDISALANWNTAGLTEVYNVFSGCASLTDISALENWQVGNCTNFAGVFGGCTSLADFTPVANWDLSQNTSLNSTFSGTALTNTDALAKWGVGNVYDISAAFASCANLTDLKGLSSWSITPTVAQYTFMNCASLKNLEGLKDWDVSQCQYFTYMFCADTALEDASAIGGWQPAQAVDMSAMFANDAALTTIDLNPLANNAAQTQAFAGIDVSNIRHFKTTELQADTEAIMAENNICDTQNMEGEGLIYRLRGTDTTYASWAEVLNNWDEVSNRWIDIEIVDDDPVILCQIKFFADEDFTKEPIATLVRTNYQKIGEIDAEVTPEAGYEFAGWYYKLAGEEIEVNSETNVERDMDIYPKWSPVVYKIVYNGCEDAINSNPSEYTIEDETIVLKKPAKEGWKFEGWSDAEGNKVEEIKAGSFGDITLNASWSKVAPDDGDNPVLPDDENEDPEPPVIDNDTNTNGDEDSTEENVDNSSTETTVEETEDISTGSTSTEGSSSTTTTESNSLPSTGDMTLYSLVTALFAGVFSAGVLGRKKLQDKKLENKKH